jgi:RHS repeat-associated protein
VDYYYNESWQVLEEREDGGENPLDQYVWDIRYIDAPVVRFHDGNTDGDYLDAQDNTLYYTQDANMNATALVSASGTVVERCLYDPYGKATFLDGNWAPTEVQGHDDGTVSVYASEILYAGYRHDPETGMYQVRFRYYHPTLGRWTARDPSGYRDGANMYVYASNRPTLARDPQGLGLMIDLNTPCPNPWGSEGPPVKINVEAMKIRTWFLSYGPAPYGPRGGGHGAVTDGRRPPGQNDTPAIIERPAWLGFVEAATVFMGGAGGISANPELTELARNPTRCSFMGSRGPEELASYPEELNKTAAVAGAWATEVAPQMKTNTAQNMRVANKASGNLTNQALAIGGAQVLEQSRYALDQVLNSVAKAKFVGWRDTRFLGLFTSCKGWYMSSLEPYKRLLSEPEAKHILEKWYSIKAP